MAVIEGQFQRILPGGLDLGQADSQFAELQDRPAVALNLGRRGMHPQKFGGQMVFLIRRVFQRQGFGGFMQLDGGWEH